MRLDDFIPWHDRAGRFSALRASAFAAAVAPAAWIVTALWAGWLAAEPFKQATHLTGTWTLYFLLASLAVTPLKGLLGWSRLIAIRRLLGVTAFTYAASHLLLYVLSQDGNLARVASEIASRIYLTIGFVTVTGLALLAGTSFDAAMRRLRRNWKRLHRLAYPLTALGLLHFYMQSKSDVSDPVLLSGIFVALMLHRAWPRIAPGAVSIAGVLAVAAVSGLAAAILEYAWYATTSGIPAERVLLSNLDFSHHIRPMWIAMAICALPAALMLVRRLGKDLRPAAQTR